MSVAGANPPSSHAPYAFEKRILARLTARPALDHWAVWARALWFAAAPCVAVMLLLSAWSFFGQPANPTSSDLSQEFENTVLAPVDQRPVPASRRWTPG